MFTSRVTWRVYIDGYQAPHFPSRRVSTMSNYVYCLSSPSVSDGRRRIQPGIHLETSSQRERIIDSQRTQGFVESNPLPIALFMRRLFPFLVSSRGTYPIPGFST